ncbi:zf-HC2 domain-containing protein [Streptomyces sp. NPDC002205]|uniref:anti-sigma factor family protein n=1 Tax=unclassified Streptomyces TaxID=2593676 RepID=UPI00331BCDF0
MSDSRAGSVPDGMRTPEPHRNVGAYALGVLGAADAFRFEEHLTQCPLCEIRAAEFGAVTAVLAEHARRTPPGVDPVVRAGPELMRRAVGAVVAARHRSRRRRLALVAAAVVLAVGGPLVVVGESAGSAGPPGQTQLQRWAAADRSTGVAAVVTTGAKEWGTDVGLEVSRVPLAGVCALVAVGRDGSEETVTTWSVAGPDEKPLSMQGGAALHPAAIDRFEIRAADGRRLLQLTR